MSTKLIEIGNTNKFICCYLYVTMESSIGETCNNKEYIEREYVFGDSKLKVLLEREDDSLEGHKTISNVN